MIELDGSVGEGGGQILRTSLSLAMCTGQAFTLDRIRARRSKPGLMRQHLTCVQAAAKVSGAAVRGAEPGSTTLVFEPGPVKAGDYEFSVGTAGSCTLVLQTLWPALMLAGSPSRLKLSGGTHNPMAPPFHFLERCYAPLLRRLGAGSDLDLRRLGFYPAGGGEMATLAYENVSELFTQFGEKGVSSDSVANALVKEVRAYEASTAALGPHLADQWALPLALAVWRRGGEATYTCTELTDHATTNFSVIERFLPVRFVTEAIAGGWSVFAKAC